MSKLKRKLTKEEVDWISDTMNRAPQGRKPTLRWFAKRLGVNQPSVAKALGGWKGVERGRPVALPKPRVIKTDLKPLVEIQPYTRSIEEV